MKKIIIFILIILFLIPLFSTSYKAESNRNDETRGIFISYIELGNYLRNRSEDEGKRNIREMISNTKNLGFNLIILQVRSFNDAIYSSEIFPWSGVLSDHEGISPSYDILDYFISYCHENNLKLYAWFNPYRVRGTEDLNSISLSNPAYKYIGTDYLYINNGIYLNPSKSSVTDLIVSAVSEVINNYKVDGVLFDDYFYPSSDIDYNDYLEYKKDNPYISLDEYHLMIINKMILEVHRVCSLKHVLFGVSPDGNISNNYNKNYADVKRWMSSSLYIDFIMPQIYYGFYNQTMNFYSVSLEWDNLIKDKSIDLYVALPFYKVGNIDLLAKNGINEWVSTNNIIMKQIIVSRNLKHYKGFSLFRYDNIFNNSLYTNTSIDEIKNMKKILK